MISLAPWAGWFARCLSLTANIVTGIMLGFAALVIGRVVSGDFKRLNIGTVVIAIVLVAFYACGWAI